MSASLGRPLRARREHLSPAADDGDLLSALVFLAAERVPVAALPGGLPEALRSQVRVHVDATHRLLLSLLSLRRAHTRRGDRGRSLALAL